MPEQYRPKRALAPYMLSDAIRQGDLVEARCVGCSPPRWYHPEDLKRLYGNVPCSNLEFLMHCGRCGSTLAVDVAKPAAEKRNTITVRRLDRVWWVRRVTWKDER